MTNREHFIATLQACYFGDRDAFNEIVGIYDSMQLTILSEIGEYHGDMYITKEMEYQKRKELQQRIDKAIELINSEDIIVKKQEFENKNTVNFYDRKETLLNILKGDDINES